MGDGAEEQCVVGFEAMALNTNNIMCSSWEVVRSS